MPQWTASPAAPTYPLAPPALSDLLADVVRPNTRNANTGAKAWRKRSHRKKPGISLPWVAGGLAALGLVVVVWVLAYMGGSARRENPSSGLTNVIPPPTTGPNALGTTRATSGNTVKSAEKNPSSGPANVIPPPTTGPNTLGTTRATSGNTMKIAEKNPDVKTETNYSKSKAASVSHPPVNTWVRIVNRNSGMGIAVREDKRSVGTDVIQWGAGTEWMLRSRGDYWIVQNRISQLYLSIMNSSRKQGAALCQDVPEVSACEWMIEPAKSPFWTIRNRNSGQVMAVPGGQRNRGAVVCQMPFCGGDEQQWRFLSAEHP